MQGFFSISSVSFLFAFRAICLEYEFGIFKILTDMPHKESMLRLSMLLMRLVHLSASSIVYCVVQIKLTLISDVKGKFLDIPLLMYLAFVRFIERDLRSRIHINSPIVWIWLIICVSNYVLSKRARSRREEKCDTIR